MNQSQSQELVFTNSVGAAVDAAVERYAPPSVFLIADTNVGKYVLPLLCADSKALAGATKIIVPAGEENKNIDTLASIWRGLCDRGATRGSLAVNVGGGVVTDMGGFAAATFKRGISFVNVPTTLLGAVDAAVGGKTGIDFLGFKNEIGAFACALTVVVSSRYLSTLPAEELRSGYAEMIKHALLGGMQATDEIVSAADPAAIPAEAMLEAMRRSVAVKRRIVEEDPTEKGLRKALNLGHTVGHAFESAALAAWRPVPHGYAVAWGLVVALVLSHIREGFDPVLVRRIADYIAGLYGTFPLSCDDYPLLLELMRHDKKNTGDGSISFTLLKAPGNIVTGVKVPDKEILTALDIFRDLLHI